MSNELIAEAIERAALVIRLPGWWTQDRTARYKGTPCSSSFMRADCFCGSGAATEAAAELGVPCSHVWGALDRHSPTGYFPKFNDLAANAEEVSDAMLACAHELRKKGGK